MILYVLFFLSGAAALVYEVLWLKELGLLFGNTAYAASTTLAVFFLGMAVGAQVLGRRAAQLARPLLTYGLLEIGIALAALLYFALTPLFGWIYGGLYPHLGQNLALMTLVKLVLAVGLLFPPAFLMGGTLPVMGQHLIRRRSDLGRTGTLLYLVNTTGAATGALLAGFVLPARLGFRDSYLVAIALSLLVGVAAWLLDRSAGAAATAAEEPEEPAAPDLAANSLDPGAIRAVAFLSGFLVLGLEVVWTRMLAQVLHNSVYSFTAILVTFLVALACGSAIANLLSRRAGLRPRRVLAVLGAACWLLIAASTLVLDAWTGGLGELAGGGGWGGYVGRVFLLAVVVMLPPGILAGTIYPYLLKVSEATARGAGRTIGNLAAVNSVGGILGSLAAGFVLLPVAGLWSSVDVLAGGYLLLGGVALAGRAAGVVWPRAAGAAAVGTAVLVLAVPDLPVARVDAAGGEVLVEAWEGRHGTVAVVDRGPDRYIKLDSGYSLGGVAAFDSEQGQARIPLFVVPPPESVFFLGMGTGITAGGALAFPVQRLVTCELVPEVVTAARKHFADYTNGLFSDPRSRIVVEDGRHHLAATRESFDLIISDLFVPWHAGTGSLYTREHFEICRARLTEGGHFVLWVPAQLLSRAEFDVLARTVLEVFPEVTVWRGEFVPEWPTLGLICSEGPRRLDPAQARRNVAQVVVDRAPERVTDADVLPWVLYAGNLGTSAPLFAHAAVNTDDRPIIEYGSPRTQQQALSSRAAWLRGDELVGLLDDLAAATPPARDPFLAGCGAEQLAYVHGGQLLHKVGTHLSAGRTREAAALYRQFLALIPFDIFPGLAAQ